MTTYSYHDNSSSSTTIYWLVLKIPDSTVIRNWELSCRVNALWQDHHLINSSNPCVLQSPMSVVSLEWPSVPALVSSVERECSLAEYTHPWWVHVHGPLQPHKANTENYAIPSRWHPHTLGIVIAICIAQVICLWNTDIDRRVKIVRKLIV